MTTVKCLQIGVQIRGDGRVQHLPSFSPTTNTATRGDTSARARYKTWDESDGPLRLCDGMVGDLRTEQMMPKSILEMVEHPKKTYDKGSMSAIGEKYETLSWSAQILQSFSQPPTSRCDISDTKG
jgi:hypothetical protein